MIGALLPPASLAVLALVLLLCGRRRAGAAALLALLLLAVPAIPHALVAPLLEPVTHEPSPPGASVVLATADPGSPGMLLRLRAAAALARRTGLPVLVGGPPSIASSLHDDFGVEPRWTETGVSNVWQGAAVAAARLRAAGIGTAYLVGEPWEARLASSVFAAAGLPIWPVSATNTLRRRLDWTSLLPITPAWLYSADILGQWVGLACQSIPLCVRRLTPDPS